MGMTREDAAALQDDSLTKSATEEIHAETPASGEHEAAAETPETPEQPAEPTPKSGEQPTEPEAEGEKKPEDPKAETKPETEKRSWKDVEAAKKAQIKLSQQRTQIAQQAERVRAFEQHLDARDNQIKAREARIAPLEKALETRDLGALLELGFDYERFTREHLEANTPEGQARAAMEETKRLRAELAEKDRKATDEARTSAQIAETRRIASTLVELVEKHAEEHPDLYTWTPERIAYEGVALRDQYVRQHRQQPTYDFVMQALQRSAKAENEQREQRQAELQKRKSPTTRDAGSAGKTDPKGASGSPNTTPALSNKTAGDRQSPSRDATEDEVDAECRAMLRGLKR